MSTRSLVQAHLAERGDLLHDWTYGRFTGTATCTVCHTVGIGDDEDTCTGPVVWALWNGGPSFAQSTIADDLEKFTGLAAAKEAFEERMHADRFQVLFQPVHRESYTSSLPGVTGSTMTVWFYDPTEESDPYPDLHLHQGDDDSITEEEL